MYKKALEKNQQITLDITGFTAEGGGVGHYQLPEPRGGISPADFAERQQKTENSESKGMAVFVAGAAAGDKILCHIIKVKKNYAVGKIIKILKPSKARVPPDCHVFPRCGGCVFRHINYQAELELKQQRVRDVFLRIGHIDIEPEEIIGADDINRYRNKAQYPVRREDGLVSIGFFAGRSHRVIDCLDCALQPKEFADILAAFEEWIKSNNISIYDETINTGLLRHIYLRKAFATGEIMACAVINGNELPYAEDLTRLVREAAPALGSLAVNYNAEDTNVILGGKYDIIWGGAYIEDVLCGIRVRLSPLSFYQVNHAQAEKLYALAAEYAGLTGNETVLDLYCGAGTIGLSLAHKAKKVIGVELVPDAVRDARINAEINGIKNAEFICADAESASEELKARGVRPDVVILDPPRKGCGEKLLDMVAEISVQRIVYVSCDPATLARDCAVLREKGYRTLKVAPVDMFPRTAHVETCVLLSHKKPDSHINVKVEFGEGEGKVPLDKIAERAEAYKPKERVTYKMMKEYIEAKYGFKVHTAYIAEVKRSLGLPMYDAPNAVDELKQPRKHPTPEKVEAIKDALKYFGVVVDLN